METGKGEEEESTLISKAAKGIKEGFGKTQDAITKTFSALKTGKGSKIFSILIILLLLLFLFIMIWKTRKHDEKKKK